MLLFDGECGLCNRVVRLLLATDKTGRLRFAPLQSPAAQTYLRDQGLPTADFDSLILVLDWDHPAAYPPLLRTDGALGAAAEVGGIWRLVTWTRVLPAGMRDPFYKLIARFRYTLFGEYRPKPLKHPEWEKRFVDRM